MEITILGSGSSAGTPVIGCSCAVCLSPLPENKRMRSSVYIRDEGRGLLIDTSPDLRAQALRFGVSRIDAVLFTHAHADHVHGVDEIKSFSVLQKSRINAYSALKTLAELKERFGYCFREPDPEYGWFRPSLLAHEIRPMEEFRAAGFSVLPIEHDHGRVTALTFRIGGFAYSTDVKTFPPEALAALRGVDTWVVDCLDIPESPTHSHLAKTLEWIEEVKPARAVLTHMNHHLEYNAFKSMLPGGVEPAFDGMRLTL